jgi:UDP-N-acetylmuramate: L-alanyl-gamma-D-glutamyl-meso-diaminopimelate ligase
VEGYEAPIDAGVESVVVGNALSRGLPVVEALLNSGRPYSSGPQWLAEHVLHDKWVLAVSGTHGKTTTTSMLAWILEYAGLKPGFLVGGVPTDFGISARLGGSKYFVVEADEYDTAFFDKRAKFVHYRPRTLIVNNIEFDHADIYSDIEAIIWQFHQLLRTVPGNGLVVANGKDANIERLLQRGVWTPLATFSAAERAARWFASYDSVGAVSAFSIFEQGTARGSGRWSLLGQHNLENALAAIAAAGHVGVTPAVALAALAEFKGVKRRLELRGTFGGISLYEDFAHHPTAIATTLAGLKRRAPGQRIVAVMEPRSNTMRMGVHRDTLHASFTDADCVFVLGAADLGWDPAAALAPLGRRLSVESDVQALLARLLAELAAGDQVVLMSNGSFQGLPRLLEQALQSRMAS